MAANRAGEQGNIPQREERFLEQHQAWFFQTREGAVEGPFDTKNHANRALDELLEFMSSSMPQMPL